MWRARPSGFGKLADNPSALSVKVVELPGVSLSKLNMMTTEAFPNPY
jgi:hypothetical protein